MENSSNKAEIFKENKKSDTIKNTSGSLEKSRETDRKLKSGYGICLIILLFFQLITVNVVFILYGTGVLKYENNVLNLYVSATLIEIISLVHIIVKSLFGIEKNEKEEKKIDKDINKQ